MQFEILVSRIYEAIVEPGDEVIDGGANAGLHAVPLARLVGPGGRARCIEANPKMAEKLKRNLASYPHAEVTQLAISDTRATAEFMVNDDNPGLSHLSHDREPDSECERIVVDTDTLDNLFPDSMPTFIKLDLEGADFLALKGARQLLARSRPIIVFENSRQWAAKCHGYTSDEFFAHFSALGYRIFDLHGVELTPDNWSDQDVAFEFFAGHADDPRLPKIRDLVEAFWREIDDRPVLSEWKECVASVRSVASSARS